MLKVVMLNGNERVFEKVAQQASRAKAAYIERFMVENGITFDNFREFARTHELIVGRDREVFDPETGRFKVIFGGLELREKAEPSEV